MLTTYYNMSEFQKTDYLLEEKFVQDTMLTTYKSEFQKTDEKFVQDTMITTYGDFQKNDYPPEESLAHAPKATDIIEVDVPHKSSCRELQSTQIAQDEMTNAVPDMALSKREIVKESDSMEVPTGRHTKRRKCMSSRAEAADDCRETSLKAGISELTSSINRFTADVARLVARYRQDNSRIREYLK
jgi:hypothetical protein